MRSHLRVVQPTPEVGLESIHPKLEMSAAIVETLSDDTQSVTFAMPFEASDVVSALSNPIAPFVGQFGALDVRNGLRKLTYPNSRVMRNAGLISASARPATLEQRPQIKGLMDVIDHPDHHEMVPVKVHVLDPEMVEYAAWFDIGDMKPSEIKRHAEKHGITYDQMRVWRAKGGDRTNRASSMYDLGLIDTGITEAYIGDTYAQKTTIPGAEPVFVPVEDLPATSWARDPGYLELLKRLPQETPDQLGDRWEALLRREDTPRHVVFPKILWRTDTVEYNFSWLDMSAEYHRQHYSWQAPHKHLVHVSEPPVYNPARHTIEHTSTMLGAALLAGHVDPSAMRSEFIKLQQGRHYQFYDRNRFVTPKLAGTLPLLVQSPYLMARILSTDAYRQVEQLANLRAEQ